MKQIKSRQKGQNMIAIASGKGGVGKTWLSVSLSAALAEKGEKILLFDGDLGLPNVDIQLGIATENDLSGVLMNKISLSDAITTYVKGGFDVITSASGSGTLANVPPSKLQDVFENLELISAHYDHVVLDLGAGVEKNVRMLCAHAGILFVVCTDEPTSLTDAYALIKVVLSENPEADIRILINGVDSIESGKKTFMTLSRACENFLSFTPAFGGIVREDPHVRMAIKAQQPAFKMFPESTCAQDIQKILENSF